MKRENTHPVAEMPQQNSPAQAATAAQAEKDEKTPAASTAAQSGAQGAPNGLTANETPAMAPACLQNDTAKGAAQGGADALAAGNTATTAPAEAAPAAEPGAPMCAPATAEDTTSAAQSGNSTSAQSAEAATVVNGAASAAQCLQNDTADGQQGRALTSEAAAIGGNAAAMPAVQQPFYTAPKAQAPAAPFVAQRADWLFALLYFVLGECYWRVLLKNVFSDTWAGAAAFTVIYAACVLGYVFAKRRTVPRTSWFWLAVLLAQGVGSTLWPNTALTGYAGIFLHATAIYWTLCATGALVAQQTSCFLPADLLNGFVVLPFANFFARIRCLWHAVRRGVPRKNVLQVLLGVALLAGVLCLVLPRLATADEAFYNVFDAFMHWLARFANGEVLQELEHFLFALPVAAYLFGLAYGAINRRHTQHLAQPRLQKMLGGARVVPGVSVQILLGGICALYVLFIALQAQQLFAAFRGQLSGTQIYSQYAREGFFGLCQVAVINGAVLLFVQVFARGITRAVKVLQTALCVLTLLILASAARKLALYIEAYDLTPSRLLAIVFMVWLAVVFTALVVRLYVPFPFTRTVVCVGAVLVVLLFVCNVDACIESFNAAHVCLNELHGAAAAVKPA